jgi:hypothetical protein
MRTISTVQCGIKALEEVLNRIVAAVNARTVVAGAGLTSQETPENIVISVANKDDDHGQTGTQGGGQGGGGMAFTPTNQIIWQGVRFQNITVMDANCNSSTLSVIVSTGNNSDAVVINIQNPTLAAFPTTQ